MSDKILKDIRKENGQAALLMVLIIMALLLFVGLFLTNTVIKQIKMTKNAEQFTQAYFLADTGTERILYNIFKEKTINLNEFNDGDPLSSGNIAGLGSFNTILKDDSPLVIKTEGVCKNTGRAIEISW